MDRSTTVVVPCFNEAGRLRLNRFRAFASANPHVSFLFVNDGSTDLTGDLLQKETAAHPHLGAVLSLERNVGKGEAVRFGLRHAMQQGARFVAYWDADLATPLEELVGMVQWLETDEDVQGIFASRVKLLGRSIERRAIRHYVGRVFATAASLALDLPVYDTQCGAKVFRATDELQGLLEDPFDSRWIFDVELLARFKEEWGSTVCEKIREHPIDNWQDVGGSKLKPRDFLWAVIELARVRMRRGKGHLKGTGGSGE